MYQDPKLVRVHRVTTNLDEYEHRLLQSLADYTGRDKASLIREMIMAQAVSLLGTAPAQCMELPDTNTGTK